DVLYAVGELSRATAAAFGESARHFPDQSALIQALRSELTAGTTLLVKGSRGSAMERVVNALLVVDAEKGERHAA
ncbi:MAG: UDP-N-acetylmuramoyl-tripeptide--D-alanyl-D-alanine ligase, partial [Dokdonella sp.]